MAELTVAATYAKALLDVAMEMDKVDLVAEELDALKGIFDKEPEFKKLIESPTVSVGDKKNVIETVFEGKMSQEVVNFLYVLVDKGRANQIERIIKQYKAEVAELNHLTNGTIYSVAPLKKDKLEEFEKQVSKLLDKNVKLDNQIDQKLIAGVKILVEGKIIDASAKHELGRMLRDLQN